MRFYSIQALRGVAALLVVASHALVLPMNNNVLDPSLLQFSHQIGGIGVTTFFVISGFIMITSSFEQFGSSGNSVRFFLRRLVRIVPIYWLATFAVLVPLALRGDPVSTTYIVGSFLLFPVVISPGSELAPILAQGWTLNYEMYFYVLFALSLLFNRRIGLPFLLLSFPAIVFIGILATGGVNTLGATTVLDFYTHPMILLFGIGILIGLAYRRYHRHARFKAPIWSVIALYATTLTFLFAFKIPHDQTFAGMILLWLPSIVSVIICVFEPMGGHTLLMRVFEHFGNASYSTYLFHSFALWAVGKLVSPMTLPTTILYVVACVVLANLAGLLLFAVVERPLNSTLKSRL